MSGPEPAVDDPQTGGPAQRSAPSGKSPRDPQSGPSTRFRDGRYAAFRRRSAAAAAKLDEVYEDLPERSQLSNAQRWLFDNDYLLWRALTRVAGDMPRAFFERLRTVQGGATRIEAVLARYLGEHEGRVVMPDLLAFLDDYQADQPLDLAELWAVPTMLRLALVEALLSDLDDESVVAAAVLGVHEVERQDWTRFVEATSVVEKSLTGEPAGIYPLMDDATRDSYRKAVERMSLSAGVSESRVCAAALAAAADGAAAAAAAAASAAAAGGSSGEEDDASLGHVGTYLVGHLRPELEGRLGYRPGPLTRLRRASALAPVLYVTALVLLTVLLTVPLIAYGSANGGGWRLVVTLLALAIPLWLAAEVLIQRLAAALVAPRVLPKLDLQRAAGAHHRALIAIPCMLTDERTIEALFENLERHYVVSAVGPLSGRLSFALLADLPDAESETAAADVKLVGKAVALLADLRARNPTGDFHLLLRRRLFNEAEGVWMGWERKRGKLMELNALLLESATGTFTVPERPPTLAGVRYVVTLDADTAMQPGTVAALIGTLSHPLNRARFDAGGEVVGGYTVLQPRVEVAPGSEGRTAFTRMYAGSRGLDLYSQAVSNTYMDLFGEGIYAGKGIYDVASFHRTLHGAVPENAILSHDLFEGGRGRAGLVTDVVLFEGIPTRFPAYLHRQRRWVRGDWQLLPFLRGAGLSWVAGWAAVHNLLRSVAPLAYLVALVAAFLAPGAAGAWIAATLVLLGAPYLVGMFNAVYAARGADGRDRWGLGGVLVEVERWAFELVVLPVNAVAAVVAIVVTLRRMYVTHEHLLRWRGAAREQADAEDMAGMGGWWRELAAAPLTAVAAALLLSTSQARAPFLTLPILGAWLLAPAIAWSASRTIAHRPAVLTAVQQRRLRVLARRTWLYFERFVGPEDHWLPPDHFQEEPRGAVAHRTSPTNIGLLLTSTHGAYDLGFLGARSLIGRLNATFATMASLETHRGHLLNWYDTKTLRPLAPAYVSTVDSGNLLACLVAVKGGCLQLEHDSVNRWESFAGLLTLLDLYDQSVMGLPTNVGALRKSIVAVTKLVREAADLPRRWPGLMYQLEDRWLPRLDTQLLEAVRRAGTDSDHEQLAEMAVWSGRLHRHVQEVIRDVTALMPWSSREFAAAAARFGDLPAMPSFAELPQLYDLVAARLEEEPERGRPAGVGPDAGSTCHPLLRALDEARALLADLNRDRAAIAAAAEAQLEATDLSFLYDDERNIFRIGFDVANGRLDGHAYDLFASEARLASFVGIAYGKVPFKHWLHLSRPYSMAGTARVLMSWSGTMFEYLTPSLLLPTPAESVTAHAIATAIERQVAFGENHSVPWGVSESGYALTDAQQNYQYYAFGVPDLALARVATDDLVIAPYASLMALPFEPRRVMANLERLEELGALGQYGFYEALDFTAARRTPSGAPTVVRSFMAHHHGMAFMAIDNALTDGAFVERFRHDVRVRGVEYLLHEGTPATVKLERLDDREQHAAASAPDPLPDVAWEVKPMTAAPLVNTVSNGRLTVMTTNGGGGFARWNGLDLTRWRSDPTVDGWGEWLYVRDSRGPAPGGAATQAAGDGASGTASTWSATRQPCGPGATSERVTFRPHATEYARTVNGVNSRLAVTVAPDDDVVIRLLSLTNGSDTDRELEVTSYGEVVLAEHGGDVRHPAFGKLFVESSYRPELGALLFRRRPRSASERPPFLLHMLVSQEELAAPLEYDSDRRSFIGRGNSLADPAGPRAATLAGTSGTTLDPVFALRARLTVRPHGSRSLASVLVTGTSRRAVLATAARYRQWHRLEAAFEEARVVQGRSIARSGTSSDDLPEIQRLLSRLLFPARVARAAAGPMRANTSGQRALWAHGISGDHPILLVKVEGPVDLDAVRIALLGHRRWREQGFTIDLVVLNEGDGGYRQNTNDALRSLINASGNDQWLERPGGIFLLNVQRLEPSEATLIEAVATVVIGAGSNFLKDEPAADQTSLPAFTATNPEFLSEYQGEAIERPPDLEFDNGYGGFADDGREYVIFHPAPDAGAVASTPAPWVNVIANPTFGTLVSEVGSSTTWAVNSSENRLTPWSNDVVLDPSGEVLYLRDEETAAVWSATPGPRPAAAPYLTRHAPGSSAFEHRSNGLDMSMTVFVPPDAPVKLVRLRLKNRSARPRRLTATYYAQLLLGTSPEATRPHVVAEFDAHHQALVARNPFNQEFGSQVAFLAASLPVHGVTTDRSEFIGREGSLADPQALRRVGLSGSLEPGGDPCAALQVHLDLAPQADTELHFVLGRAADRSQAGELLELWRRPERVAAAWRETNEFWDQLLGAIQVRTPDRAMDIVLNGWLLYQTVSCRLWGRSAFYQSSGAYGFRDQLQDALALVHVRPDLLRQQLLEAARHQFEEGDVLHWWHPPGGQGVRTRFSDDLAWLPFAAAHYLDATGDTTVLDESVPYLTGPVLPEGVDENYDKFEVSTLSATLYQHCLRAIERACTTGRHGLPLMGSGDWNDGMNRVGDGGQGESVWLGWFLTTVLRSFAAICERRGDRDLAVQFRARAEAYREAIEEHAWDGDWYIRAFYDDGTPLGSHLGDEPKIDALAQAWAVLSGAGRPDRARRALLATRQRLVDEDDGLVLLLAPPFDKGSHDPGYIKGYPPGVRENGGQYTHAAAWTLWALAGLGGGTTTPTADAPAVAVGDDLSGVGRDPDPAPGRPDPGAGVDPGILPPGLAARLFAMINPLNHTSERAKADKYRVEPYVAAADVYGAAPHTGRGGWTWYTGSAAWLYRLGVERLLGVTRHGDTLHIEPQVPPEWPGFVVSYRYGSSLYRITVQRPADVDAGDRSEVDGDAGDGAEGAPDGGRIRLVDDGMTHDITVTLRSPAAAL